MHKAAALTDLPDLRLRLIGHLQRNKIKDVLRAAATVDTLDSIRLAEALAERASAGGTAVSVLVQVNIGDEPQKSGVAESALPELVAAIRGMASLQLQGLLAIPPAAHSPDARRPMFRRCGSAGQLALPELSIGRATTRGRDRKGATMGRIGTAIFGQRP